MAKKSKKMTLVQKVATFLISGVMFFGLGFLLSTIQTLTAGWYNVIQGVIGLALFGLGMKMRPGKEDFVQSLGMLIFFGVIFQLIEKLPMKIPFFHYAVEFSVEGLAMLLGVMWTAESIVRKVL
jgi:hypothetical protein